MNPPTKTATPPPLYNLAQVAEAMGMSVRWVRGQVANGAAHTRLGRKIRFTDDQYRALLAAHTSTPAVMSVTTGRKRAV